MGGYVAAESTVESGVDQMRGAPATWAERERQRFILLSERVSEQG